MSDITRYNTGSTHVFTLNSENKEIVLRASGNEKLILKGDLDGNVLNQSVVPQADSAKELRNDTEYNRKKIDTIQLIAQGELVGVDVSLNKFEYDLLNETTPYATVTQTPLLKPGDTTLPGGTLVFDKSFNLIQTIGTNLICEYTGCDPTRGYRSNLYNSNDKGLLYINHRWNEAPTPVSGTYTQRYIYNPTTGQHTRQTPDIEETSNEFIVGALIALDATTGKVYKRPTINDDFSYLTMLTYYGKDGDLNDNNMITLDTVDNDLHMYKFKEDTVTIELVKTVAGSYDGCVCSGDFYVGKATDNIQVYGSDGTLLYAFVMPNVRRMSLFKNKLAILDNLGLYLFTLFKFEYRQDFFKAYGADWSLVDSDKDSDYEVLDNNLNTIIVGLPFRGKVFAFSLIDEPTNNAVVSKIYYENTDDKYVCDTTQFVNDGILKTKDLSVSNNSILSSLMVSGTSSLNKLEVSNKTTLSSLTVSGTSSLMSVTASSIVTSKTGVTSLKNGPGYTRIVTPLSPNIAGLHIGDLLPSSTDNYTDRAPGCMTMINSLAGNLPLYIKCQNSTRAVQFNSGSDCGHIELSGSSTTYATSSDYRLKKDIVTMTDGLDRIMAIRPVKYKWISDNNEAEGFIAHELQEYYPFAVTGTKDDPDGYQGVDTSFLVASLVSAIQNQQQQIEELTLRIEALEALEGS